VLKELEPIEINHLAMLYPKFVWFVVFDVLRLGHHTSFVCGHSSVRSVLEHAVTSLYSST
jgi:hypothetical protein